MFNETANSCKRFYSHFTNIFPGIYQIPSGERSIHIPDIDLFGLACDWKWHGIQSYKCPVSEQNEFESPNTITDPLGTIQKILKICSQNLHKNARKASETVCRNFWSVAGRNFYRKINKKHDFLLQPEKFSSRYDKNNFPGEKSCAGGKKLGGVREQTSGESHF